MRHFSEVTSYRTDRWPSSHLLCFHPCSVFIHSSNFCKVVKHILVRKAWTEPHIPEMTTFFFFFFSITIPVLAYLNLKCFLGKKKKNTMSPHNYIGICSMTIVSILIGLFGEICLDIGNSSFPRLWSLLTKLVRSRIKQFWGGNLFLILLVCTSPESQLRKKKNKTTYKICARKKLSSLLISFLPFQNRSSLSYEIKEKAPPNLRINYIGKWTCRWIIFQKVIFFFSKEKKPCLYFIISVLWTETLFSLARPFPGRYKVNALTELKTNYQICSELLFSVPVTQ